MVQRERCRRPSCPPCAEATAKARALHPSSAPGPDHAADLRLVDDLELWDAWALLGDPGSAGLHRPH